MGDLSRTIDKARRRATADIALARAGAGLVIGSLAGLCVLAAERLWGVPVWAGTYAVLPGGSALLAAASALGAAPRRLATAVRLDRALRLKDRLGTAEAAAQGTVRGEFADLARHRGERLAARLDVRAAAPIRIRPLWGGGALAVILAVGVAFVPYRAAGEPEALPEPMNVERTQLTETIERAAADLAEDGASPESVKDVEALEKLAAQLEGGGEADLQETRDGSAARLEEAAKRLAEQADRQLQSADEATRRFAGIEAPPVPGAPPQADAFMEALREGELEEAAGQFDRLMEEIQELPPPAREALAERLDRMSEDLRSEPPPETPDDREAIAEALQDLGVEEEAIDDLLRQEDPDELKEELEERSADPQTIDEIARDLEEMKRQRAIDRQVTDEQERMAEALREAAERARDPKPQDDQARGSDHKEQEQEQEQQQQEQQQEQHQQEQQQVQQQEQEQEQQQQQQQERQQQQQQERPAGQDDAAARRQARDSDQEPRGGEPTVGEVLRRLAEKRRDAEGRQEMSERLRRAARDLADSMTRQEKERLAEQWAARGAKDTEPGMSAGSDPIGGPGADSGPDPARSSFDATEDVDLRGQGSPGDETVISRWLEPEGESAQAPGGAAHAFVRRAQAEAEQAVEQSAVPSRYHALIRRYFGRLADTVEAAAAPPATTESPP